MTPIRIAFADDHPTLLKGMEAIFSDDDKFEIVATGGSADAAVRLAKEMKPDMLVIDLSMPGDVYGAMQKIARDNEHVRIIVFTAYANVGFAVKAFEAGARGFVLKGRPASDLYDAIAAVRAGELFVSPGFSDRFVTDLQARTKRDTTAAKLSRREVQIVEELLHGKTNRQIAVALGLTEKTVKHYMTNLMVKLKVKSRVAVVLVAQQRRLIQDGSGPRIDDADEALTDP